MKLPMPFFKKLEQKNYGITKSRPWLNDWTELNWEQKMLRFDTEDPKHPKQSWERNGAGRTGLPDFRLYYKVTLIKTVQYWYKNRSIDQWKKKESPK